MARVLKVSDGTTEVDFLAGPFQLQAGGWGTQDAEEGGRDNGLVWETIQAVAQDTDENIRVEKANLDRLGKLARLYKANPIRHDAVWLYWNSDGEVARRALVYDVVSQMETDEIFGGPLLGQGVALLRVAIQRKAEYEDSTPVTIDLGTIDGHGGYVALPDLGCSLEGRIAQVIIDSASTQNVKKIWLGLRPVYEGIADLDFLWEAEDGTIVGDGSSASNTFASSGTAVSIPFTDFNNLSSPRFRIRLSDAVNSNYPFYCGKYLLLGVLNVNAQSTECRVQLRHGWAGVLSTHSVLSELFIGGTSEDVHWRLRELGTIEIPPSGDRDSIATGGLGLDDYTLSIYAERLSVAGSLLIDCFILIPADALMTVNASDMDDDAGSVSGYTAPNDEQYALCITTSNLVGNVEYSFQDWKYPVGGGLATIAIDYTGSDEPDWTETVDVTLVVYPRWTSYNDGAGSGI